MSISINGSTGISGVVGTASTPALIGTDADTGLYFPTANEVALATAGSQRLLIDSSGNIVIGGTLTSGSFIPTSSTVPTNGIYLSAANTVAVATNGVGRLFVDASGRLGVGTASPNGNTNYGSLDLNGSAGGEIFFSSGGVSRGNIFNYSSTPANLGIAATDASGQIIFNTGGYIERLRIDSSGRVGIGTSLPTEVLTVAKAESANAFPFHIQNTQNWGWGVGLKLRQVLANGAGVTDSAAIVSDWDGDNNSTLEFYTVTSGSLTEKVRITPQGKFGIGTTSVSETLHLKASAPRIRIEDAEGGYSNIEGDGGNLGIYADNGNTQANSFIRFDIDGTEKSRLTSSGQWLVGTSSTSKDFSAVFQGNSADATGGANLLLARGTSSPADGSAIGYLSFTDSNHNTTAQIQAQRDGGTWTSGTSQPGRLVFSTTYDGASSPTERMRILATGFVKAKNDGGTFPTGAIHEFSSDENIYVAFRVENQNNLSGSGTYNSLLGTNCNNTSSYHFVGNTGASDKIYIYGNGNIVNSNNSYGLMSDVKLKENIVDANSQWDDLKTLRVVNFNFKEETGYQTHTQIGFIAQEVEQVSPGLVYETPDLDIEGNNLGTVTKVLQSSVLYTKAVKALQEAMERIETLEAQNSDFATRLTALESA